jgi:hypothetical protein
MSIRNGDKSRYHRMRKKKISLRERNRRLLAATKGTAAGKPSPAKPNASR